MLTRREVTILLFGLTVFILSFNTSTSSLSLASVLHRPRFYSSPAFSTPASVASAQLLLLNEDALRPDGRRTDDYVDELELQIVGDSVHETRPDYDLGPYGITMDQQRVSWRAGEVPQSRLLEHVPGFTIVDNVYVANGTIFLVSDQPSSLPKPHSMASMGKDLVSVFSQDEAGAFLGRSMPRTSGVSLLCADAPSSIDNYTLITLHRAYSTLTPSDPEKPLPPPSRTYFITTRNDDRHMTGYSTQLAHALFPYMGMLYADSWDDLERTKRPMFFDRVLLADRRAALKGAQAFDFDELTEKAKNSKPDKVASRPRIHFPLEYSDKRLSFASAFALPAPPGWWVPARNALLDLFSLPRDDPQASSWNLKSQPASRKAVTYVSMQRRVEGPRLRDADHVRLVSELKKMGSAMSVDVFVVEMVGGSGERTRWKEGLKAAVQSNVMLGVYGSSLANSIFMRPGPSHTSAAVSGWKKTLSLGSSSSHSPSTVIEFFPDDKFTNEREFVTRALGIDYIAWRNTKKYPRGSLPPISTPSQSDDEETVAIDVDMVIQTVKELLKR